MDAKFNKNGEDNTINYQQNIQFEEKISQILMHDYFYKIFLIITYSIYSLKFNFLKFKTETCIDKCPKENN